MMANANEALPKAMTSTFAAATAASTDSGQRRSSRIGAHASSTRKRRCPRCGYGPTARASVASCAHAMSTTAASHWRPGRGPRDGPAAR